MQAVPFDPWVSPSVKTTRFATVYTAVLRAGLPIRIAATWFASVVSAIGFIRSVYEAFDWLHSIGILW